MCLTPQNSWYEVIKYKLKTAEVHTRTCISYSKIQLSKKINENLKSTVHFQKQGIRTLLLSLSPNWEGFWILAIKHKLYLLTEEAHPQNCFHKKIVLKLECRSVSAGRSALCTAAAASCPGGQIRSAESTHSLHTACKERQRVTDRQNRTEHASRQQQSLCPGNQPQQTMLSSFLKSHFRRSRARMQDKQAFGHVQQFKPL